jgi:outer membrane protein TolC
VKIYEESLIQEVRNQFLHYFEAKALEQIARQSETELNDEVTIAKAKLKAGVLTNADLLRIEVAAANAQQQEIVAHTQGDVARATILIAIGVSPEDPVELVEPSALIAAARGEIKSFSGAMNQAFKSRPELLNAQLVVDSARHQEKSRLISLLPDVNLEGGYQRIDGQIFAPQNAAFIGIKATWMIWDWGATWYLAKAAQAQTEAAEQALLDKKANIGLQVASELAQSNAARSAVHLAEQSIESAQEAYRVTDALVKAGSATTTDLLESQSALNQARLNLVRAQYQLALAYVAIQHAIGSH